MYRRMLFMLLFLSLGVGVVGLIDVVLSFSLFFRFVFFFHKVSDLYLDG